MANNSPDLRYNRQSLIKGWDQTKLSDARVTIIGGGHLANFTAASLSALGIGSIELYDDSKVKADEEGFLLATAKAGKPRAKALEEMLKTMNPEIKVKGVQMRLTNSPLVSILGTPNLLIDLTNSSASKSTIMKYAQSKGVGMISASADAVGAEMYIVRGKELVENASLKTYDNSPQGAIPSEIMAGMITEEVRKLLMPIGEFESPVKNLAYSLASERRFSSERSEEITEKDLKGKKVLIIGAGALGNFAALGMALAGVGKIDIMDYDEVDTTNLNRQILFYDAVGKKKSEALAQKLREINPRIKVNGLVDKLDEKTKYFDENKPDLIMDCVDSFAVRANINYFAVRYGIPLVSGGTDPRAGQVVVYRPGQSECLDCKLGVEKALGVARTSTSCKFAPDPSVIMTNEVVGGMMVGEARKVLDDAYGTPVTRMLKYDSEAGVRGGLVGVSDPCHCEKPEVGVWLKQVIDKYGVKGAKK